LVHRGCGVVIGGREVLDRDRHEVVADRLDRFLVEVVTDPGPVSQEVLDGHVVGDLGEPVTEQ